jgi:hypothetical protein
LRVTAPTFAYNGSIKQSPDAEWRDKLAAHRDNNERLGLYPLKMARLEGTGPDGTITITNHPIIAESAIDRDLVTGGPPAKKE